MPATRADVAKRAGVSPALVSYVLNGGPRPVSDAARRRILQAIAELEYHPNSIARSLRRRSTETLGLIVPDGTNPLFAQVSRSIEDAAYAAGHMLLLGNALGDGERQARYVRTFLDQQVAGLAIVPSSGLGDDWRLEVKSSQTPLVVIDGHLASPTVSSVMIENESGARVAVEHLVDAHGCREIACLAGPSDVLSAEQRVAGWRAALSGRGVEGGESRVVRSGLDRAAARNAAIELLADPSLDGIFVTSDEQALGVLRAAAELGRRIPDDLALVSFDGIVDGRYTTPTLSTMQQPFDAVGSTVIELLLERRDESLHRRLDVELVRAESCGCAGTSMSTDAR